MTTPNTIGGSNPPATAPGAAGTAGQSGSGKDTPVAPPGQQKVNEKQATVAAPLTHTGGEAPITPAGKSPNGADPKLQGTKGDGTTDAPLRDEKGNVVDPGSVNGNKAATPGNTQLPNNGGPSGAKSQITAEQAQVNVQSTFDSLKDKLGQLTVTERGQLAGLIFNTTPGNSDESLAFYDSIDATNRTKLIHKGAERLGR